MKKSLLIVASLLVGTPVLAAAPPKETQPAAKAGDRARPCQGNAPQRNTWPQGTLLWGSTRKEADKEMSTLLASIDLGRMRLGGTTLKGVRIEDGRLVAPGRAAGGLVGATLQGTASDGQPVEVALCGAEPEPGDASMMWYRLEVWNADTGSWENPCIATGRVSKPRALAVKGVWDETGARQEVAGKFTFACENGAIAKCVDWGYKPWAKKDGRSLEDLHQACTRMARADYCGDGRSHTREDNVIDMYDELQLLTRTTEATAGWEPARASFEAAWTPEGASCLARTRDGRAVESVLAECPGRFEAGAKDLGEGDRCTVRRKDRRGEAALLRNHSYGRDEQALIQGSAQ